MHKKSIFNGLIHFQELTDHLSWRREHLEESPLIVLSAATSLSPTIAPTSTEWLPYNPNLSDTGCSECTAMLPVTETENLSQTDIAQKLFEIHLKHFKSPGLGGRCRLEDFTVEIVQEDKRMNFLANEQKVDYIRTVQYSIQIPEVPPTGWQEMENWLRMVGLFINF